jgi:hypothetical protein
MLILSFSAAGNTYAMDLDRDSDVVNGGVQGVADSSRYYSIVKRDVLAVGAALLLYSAGVYMKVFRPLVKLSTVQIKWDDYFNPVPIQCSYTLPHGSYLSVEIGGQSELIQCQGCNAVHDKKKSWCVIDCGTNKQCYGFCKACNKNATCPCCKNIVFNKVAWQAPVCGLCKKTKIPVKNTLIKEHNCIAGKNFVVCGSCIKTFKEKMSDINCPFCYDGKN